MSEQNPMDDTLSPDRSASESRALSITTVLLVAGVLLILLSFFLPWYQWDVDAAPMAEKLSHINPDIIAKYAEGSKSAEDIFANYGAMSTESLHGSDNLWQLVTSGNTAVMLFIALLLLSTLTLGGLAVYCIFKRGCEPSKRRLLLVVVPLGVAAVSLIALWFRLAELESLWWDSFPAKDAATATWRHEAMDTGLFQILTQPGYGRWLALAGLLVTAAGVVTALLRISRARKAAGAATSVPSPS